MGIRRIVQDGEDILKKKCRDVTDFNERLWQLLDDMKDTLKKANGAGLAAPQVGVMRKAAIVVLENDVMLEIINPEILTTQGEAEDAEGCLSFPGIYGMVKRPTKLTVKFQDRNGNWVMKTANDFYARAFCHEIDHLSGVCFTEHVTEFLKPEDFE